VWLVVLEPLVTLDKQSIGFRVLYRPRPEFEVLRAHSPFFAPFSFFRGGLAQVFHTVCSEEHLFFKIPGRLKTAFDTLSPCPFFPFKEFTSGPAIPFSSSITDVTPFLGSIVGMPS